MHFRSRIRIGLVTSALLGLAAAAEARALMIAAPPKPSALAGQSDIVVVGKVVEVEKDPVDATPYKGAPKGEKVAYKIAVIKIEESIIGGKGLTQFRVGFPEGATAGGSPVPPPPINPGGGAVRIRPGGGRGLAPVALTAGMEGVFFLSRHHDGDFYILAYNGMAAPLSKKDENFKKELEAVKKVAKTIDDPVSALKAKDLDDRFAAATLLLQRYNQTKTSTAREAIPDEENKLIVALMMELPWQPKLDKPRTGSDPVPPSRSQLWYMINPNEQGFKQPVIKPAKAGEPQPDYNKILDEATVAFLKDNAAKIKIKRFVK